MASNAEVFETEKERFNQILIDTRNAQLRGEPYDERYFQRWATIYDFITNSKQLITHEEIRLWGKMRLAGLIGQPPHLFAVVKDAIRRFCDRLETFEPTAGIPGCEKIVVPKLLPGSAYETLGAGGFGAVFQPALANIEGDKSVNYPGNVTKVFYRKKDADSLLAKRNVIRTVMGENEGHRITPYSYQYTAGKLPGRIFTQLLAKNPHLAANTPLHLVRLPHLGVDLSHILEIYKEVRKRPIVVILEQFQKLLHQLASLAAHKYIHGDIRTLNVMIQPATGVMTIVDFDWLLPYREFVDRFNFGFYSNPPEYLLFYTDFSALGTTMTSAQFRTMILSYPDASDEFNNYIVTNMHMYPNYYRDIPKSTVASLVFSGCADAIRYYNAQGLTLGRSAALQTFDSYALGLTLLDFMRVMYPQFLAAVDITPDEYLKTDLRTRMPHLTEPEIAVAVPALKATVKLLSEISEPRVSRRLGPAAAAARMDEIVTKYKESLIETDAGAELGKLALLMGNLSVLEPEPPAPAINNNTFAELNRLRVLEGAAPSPRANTRRGRRAKKARKTYRRRR